MENKSKTEDRITIAIIIPFYKGNSFLKRLFLSIENVKNKMSEVAKFEVIIVNDSPDIMVDLPDHTFKIKVIINPKNLGIQRTRIKGLENANSDWILFLDQDDELVLEGFKKQIELTAEADVVVGNSIYIMGDVNKKTYANIKVMRYLIQQNNFFKIRNLIPSPGECLIRKEIMPSTWVNNPLNENGADDWMLWILLFKKKAVFKCNEEVVYIHNDSKGCNLSSNLKKMRDSCKEMLSILSRKELISNSEKKKLSHAIDFKYQQDTKQLNVFSLIKYGDVFIDNVLYRITIYLLGEKK